MMPDQDAKSPSAIAIGNFDGFHQGHQKIVDELKNIALKKGLISIIITLTPNPKFYFKRETTFINTDSQKIEFLKRSDVNEVVNLEFLKIKDMTPAEFVERILINQYRMKFMIFGENFRFGKDRQGDIHVLEELSRKFLFSYRVVPPIVLEGMKISSSLIRAKIKDGEIELVNRMLGRLFFVEGKVTKGKGQGRDLGFPTINIMSENTLIPLGVFATQVEIEGQIYKSVTNIGHRPTFNGNHLQIETHILNFKQNVYHKRVRLYFEDKIRNEEKFFTKNELISQIKKDIKQLKVDKNRFF